MKFKTPTEASSSNNLYTDCAPSDTASSASSQELRKKLSKYEKKKLRLLHKIMKAEKKKTHRKKRHSRKKGDESQDESTSSSVSPFPEEELANVLTSCNTENTPQYTHLEENSAEQCFEEEYLGRPCYTVQPGERHCEPYCPEPKASRCCTPKPTCCGPEQPSYGTCEPTCCEPEQPCCQPSYGTCEPNYCAPSCSPQPPYCEPEPPCCPCVCAPEPRCCAPPCPYISCKSPKLRAAQENGRFVMRVNVGCFTIKTKQKYRCCCPC